MRNLKISTRLGLGFGIVLLLMMVAIALGVTRLRALSDSHARAVTQEWVEAEAAAAKGPEAVKAWIDERGR